MSGADFFADSVNLFNRFESTTIFRSADADRSLPVTLIVGELGAGKTSLVRRLLTNRANLRIAVAVNDFAALNVDSALIARDHVNSAGDVLALSNGCVCCSLIGSLRDAVARMLDSLDLHRIDCLVVETSGVADPWPIVAALDERFGKMYRARLDQVVAVVDASVALLERDAPSLAIRSQLEAADLVVVNKSDLVTDAERELVEQFVRRLNPTARLLAATFGDVPLPALIDVDVIDAADGQSGVLSHEQTVPTRRFVASLKGGALRPAPRQRITSISALEHDARQRLDSFSCDNLELVSLARFQDFVAALPAGVVRGKGTVLFAADANPRVAYEFNLSANGRHIDIDFARGVDANSALTQLAFIARRDADVVALETMLRNCAVVTSAAAADDDVDARVSQVPEALAKDPRLAATIEAPNVLLFRVTADFTGMSETELRAYHGITLDRINLAVLRAANAVNVARPPTARLRPALITPVRRDGTLYMRYALTTSNFDSLRLVLDAVLAPTLERELSGINCRCQY